MNRSIWLVVCSLAILGACAQKPAEPEDLLGPNLYKYRMDGSLFSQDEKQVVFTGDLGGVPNVFTYNLETAKTTPITQSKRASYAVSFLPGTSQVMYRANPEGQTAEHLFIHEAEGVADTEVMRGSPEAQVVFYAWSADRQSFYFGSNRDDRRFMYLYRLVLATKAAAMVLQTQDMRFVGASATGRKLALWQYHSINKSAIFTFDVEAKLLEKVAPEKADSIAIPQFFEVGNDHLLYYMTNEDSPVLALVHYDTEKKGRAQAYLPNEPMVFARQSANKRYFVIGVRRGEQLVSRIFDTEGGSWNEVTLPQPGLILDISPSGTLVYYTTGSENDPKSLAVYNLQTKEVRGVKSF